MSPELEELRARVSAAIQSVYAEVPPTFHGDAVVEILRTMDWAELYMQMRGVWPDGWTERVRYGMVQALSLFVPGAESSQLPSREVTEERAWWAHSALFRCGTQSLVSLFADYAAVGLARLYSAGPNQYMMRLVHADSGVEALERADMDWWRERIASLQASEEAELDCRAPQIHHRLAARMLNESDDGKGYGDDEIDLYFEERAVIHAERLAGYDYFPNGASFGGVDFFMYECAVVVLLRWALYECSRIRVQLDLASVSLDALQARELFAPVLPRNEVLALFEEALGTDRVRASQIADMFTLDADFASMSYTTIPGAANPPLVGLGDGHVALSLHGCLNAPYQFLLARLRDSYSKDWRSAANQNEAVFREQLYTLFPGDRFLCVPREIKLTIQKNEFTDIDAFVLDRETGVAGLFQLKWGFAFGASMRERSSGSTNFVEETTRWIARVDSWIRDFGLSGLANQASLRRADRRCLQRVRMFLLGRNFAHYSGQAPADDGVARGTWHQVLRLTADGLSPESPIDTLWESLRRDNPHNRIRSARGRTVITAGDFSVTLVGYEPDPDS